MAKFQKGHPGGPGRPKGVKVILRVSTVLAEAGVHPATKLIELANAPGTRPDLKKEIWETLLGYVEAPQKNPPVLIPDTPQESVESAARTMAALSEISKPLEPKSA